MIGLAKSAIFITFILIGSKVLALLKEVVLAKQFGTTYIVDSYTIACSLPTVLFTLFASGVSNTYVPVYLRIKENTKKNTFFWSVVIALTIISCLISSVCLFKADVIVEILAPGFVGKIKELTILFVRIVTLYLPFFTIFNILMAHLAAQESFVFANFCNSVVINLIVVISIFISSVKQPLNLMYGYLFSIIVPTCLLFWFTYNKGYIPSISGKVCLNDEVIYLGKSSIPVGASLLVNQVNSVIDKMFSSSLGIGITSALSYANKLQLIPYSLIVSVFLTVLKPRIFRLFADNEVELGISYIRKAFMITIFISIPVVIFVNFFSFQIIQILFERGMFTRESTIITSECLRLYVFGMPFYAFREIFNITLLANSRQKIMLYNTISTVVLNVFLNLVFTNFFGYKGLPMATSLAGIISCLYVFCYLRNNNFIILDKDMMIEIFKVVVISFFICVISNVFLVGNLLEIQENFSFVIFGGAMMVIYMILSYIFKVKTFFWMLYRLKSVLN